VQFNCVKNCTKNWTECSLAQHRFPIRFVSFFWSVLCVFLCVWLWWIIGCHMPLPFWLCCYNSYFLCPRVQLTICTLQWTQGSPVFYSLCEDECLEMMPSWCQQVNWGNCGIPWVNCAVLCVKDGWKGQFWDLLYSFPVKTAQFTQFFRRVYCYWYICQLQLGRHPVAVVQNTFTYKQYTGRHNTNNTQNHTTWKGGGRAPSLRVWRHTVKSLSLNESV
jgi:hypothetical protein